MWTIEHELRGLAYFCGLYLASPESAALGKKKNVDVFVLHQQEVTTSKKKVTNQFVEFLKKKNCRIDVKFILQHSVKQEKKYFREQGTFIMIDSSTIVLDKFCTVTWKYRRRLRKYHVHVNLTPAYRPPCEEESSTEYQRKQECALDGI